MSPYPTYENKKEALTSPCDWHWATHDEKGGQGVTAVPAHLGQACVQIHCGGWNRMKSEVIAASKEC